MDSQLLTNSQQGMGDLSGLTALGLAAVQKFCPRAR